MTLNGITQKKRKKIMKVQEETPLLLWKGYPVQLCYGPWTHFGLTQVEINSITEN